ncbi:MAG: AsmA-like C-terminal region-containing protein [Chthoniobacterales bacterium]|nr:AsmA-like C-terminal region-containing protein [Chthoniobacterales bacterium]
MRAKQTDPINNRRLLRLVILSILAFFVGVAGGIFALHRFAESENFRLYLSKTLSSLLGVNGEFSKIEWDGWQAQAGRFDGIGVGETPIQYITASNITTKLDWMALPRRQWRLYSNRVESLNIEFGDVLKARGGPVIQQNSQQGQTLDQKKKEEKKLPSFGFIPDKFVFEDVLFSSVNLKASDIEIRKAEFFLTSDKGSLKLRGRGGDFAVRDWLEGNLGNWSVELKDKKVLFEFPAISPANGGKGSIYGRNSGDSTEVNIAWEGLPFRSFLKKVDVPIDGITSGEATYKTDAAARWKCSGKIQMLSPQVSTSKLLTQFFKIPDPLVKRLSFHIPLESIKSDFEIVPEKIELKNFVISGGGIFRMEGNLEIVKDQNLDGEFLLGVSPSAMTILPPEDVKQIFPIFKDDLVWARVRITGTLQAPREDLSSRIVDSIIKKIANGVFQVPFDQQPSPEGLIKDSINFLRVFIDER